jgi:hypothetical protein
MLFGARTDYKRLCDLKDVKEMCLRTQTKIKEQDSRNCKRDGSQLLENRHKTLMLVEFLQTGPLRQQPTLPVVVIVHLRRFFLLRHFQPIFLPI